MIEKCKTCMHGYPSTSCVNCGTGLRNYNPYKPPTNADRIRGMTDEELAAFLCLPDCTAERYETCITITTEKTFDVPFSRQTDPLHDVLDWLRQPAETEGTK